jgi:hypothetical protein
MTEQWQIVWKDSGREPQVAPNPAYPEGVDVDMSAGAVQRCKVALPYPARRCGAYVLTCRRCGLRGAVTTAGRPDDPRSVTVPCKPPQEEASSTTAP